jgi:hypothetical protein
MASENSNKSGKKPQEQEQVWSLQILLLSKSQKTNKTYVSPYSIFFIKENDRENHTSSL